MATVTTPVFRISYPKLFKPELNDLNGKEEFSLVALFEKGADLSALKKAAQEAILKEFGPDQKKWPKNMRTPFRDQGDKAKENDEGVEVLPQGHTKGAIYMNLKSQQRPGVVDQQVHPILSESDLYAGCFCRAVVNFKAYEVKGNAGVSAYLQHVQKVKDGDPLGSRTRVEDAFSAIELPAGESSQEDATALFG